MKYSWVIIMLIFFGTKYIDAQIDQKVKKVDQLENDTEKVNLLNSIASEVYFTNPDEVQIYAQKALELSTQIEYEKGLAQAYNNLGIYYRAKGLYSHSIDYHFISLKIMEEIADSAGIARCYNLIGILYFYLENFDLAEEFLLKALTINEKQNDVKWIAGNTNNLGMIYERRGDFTRALKYFIESLETNISLDNQPWIANNYANIGKIYLNLKNYSLAHEYFIKQLAIKQGLGDILGVSAALYLQGKNNMAQGKFKESISLLQKSFTLADSIGSLPELRNAAHELAVAHGAIGNYEKALKYSKLDKIYNDSLNYQENIKKITRLQMRYEFQKSYSTEDFHHERTWFLYLILVLSLLFIILLAVLMYIRQRGITRQHVLKEKKLALSNLAMQNELAHKEKQLEDNILFLVSKNDLITTIIEKLVSLKSSFHGKNKAFIDETISDLQSGVTDHIWKEFELRFNQIHNDFYDKLKELYPNLTANEKKLCAFLKLNMTSKEISTISKQSIKSIEAARTRLRKKLNIKSETNLIEFLDSL